MKDFINGVLRELQNNPDTRSNRLIGIIVESAEKSIQSGERYDLIFEKVKNDLIEVNKHVKNGSVKNILDQFRKIEFKPESKLKEFAKIANLGGKLKGIKESTAYSHPMIAHKVNEYFGKLNEGVAEFTLYPSFIKDFSEHMIEKSVSSAVKSVSRILSENAADFEMLHTIHLMESHNSPMYSNVLPDLRNMLLNNTYTSDVINLKYGKTGLPIISNLVNNLKLIESKSDGSFNLGTGDSNTKIRNVVAPGIKSDSKSILTYFDNKFIRISESSSLNGSEEEVFIKKGGFTISSIDPQWVKENHSDFYDVCESFAYLGFKEIELYEGIETSQIRGFKLGLIPNSNRELDLYLNESRVVDTNNINLTEALALADDRTKKAVKKVFENIRSILNFEFIKTIKNDITLAESTVFNLGNNYFLCQKPNQVERIWDPVDESRLYEHFMNNFRYDISSIFKSAVSRAAADNKMIEDRKHQILVSVSKLEESVKRIQTAINSKDVDTNQISELERVKESVESMIEDLKFEYADVDLIKKRLNEKKSKQVDQNGDGENDWEDVKIARMKAASKASKKKNKIVEQYEDSYPENPYQIDNDNDSMDAESFDYIKDIYYTDGVKMTPEDRNKLQLKDIDENGIYHVTINGQISGFPSTGDAWVWMAMEGRVDAIDMNYYITPPEE